MQHLEAAGMLERVQRLLLSSARQTLRPGLPLRTAHPSEENRTRISRLDGRQVSVNR